MDKQPGPQDASPLRIGGCLSSSPPQTWKPNVVGQQDLQVAPLAVGMAMSGDVPRPARSPKPRALQLWQLFALLPQVQLKVLQSLSLLLHPCPAPRPLVPAAWQIPKHSDNQSLVRSDALQQLELNSVIARDAWCQVVALFWIGSTSHQPKQILVQSTWVSAQESHAEASHCSAVRPRGPARQPSQIGRAHV